MPDQLLPVGIKLPNQKRGDIAINAGGDAWRVLPVGTSGQFLWVASGLPAWRSLVLGDIGSVFATPSIVLGTAAAAGAAGTTIRSDSTIAAFDTTVPGTIAEGASAATGSVAFAARRDHTHGAPSTWTPSSHGASSHTDRTRNVMVYAQDMVGRTGQTPTPNAPATYGANTFYVAWAFDTTTLEAVSGSIRVPHDYASSGTFHLWDVNLGAGSGNVVAGFIISASATDGDDINTLTGATNSSSTITAGAQDILKIRSLTSSPTLVAGEIVHFILYRNTGSGSDTLANDWGIVALELRYTADM